MHERICSAGPSHFPVQRPYRSAPAADGLRSTERTEPGAAIRERVVGMRDIQHARFGAEKTRFNARMGTQQVRKFCAFSTDAENVLRMAMDNLSLSARAHDRILKVARTIANLTGSTDIAPDYIAEAIQCRTLERQLWR